MTRVAVVIPTWNMADTIGRAVDSCVGADEVHVIDDASTDDTQAVISQCSVRPIIWRWPRKSKCHLTAMHVVYQACDAEQIIGVGGDDVLYPGFIDAVRKHADKPVIFSDYDVVGSDRQVKWTISQNANGYQWLSDSEARMRYQSVRNATETGIASSIRRDVSDWLWECGWHKCGGHMDSIGMATAAAAFGCLLLPLVGGAYTLCDRSWGRADVQTDEQMLSRARSCIKFMNNAGLDRETIKSLVRKRCNVEVA